VHTKPKLFSASAVIFALLCVNAVIMYVDRTNISIAAPIIKKEMALDNVSIGSAFAAFSIAYAVFMVVGGRIGDIIGPRRGLLLCGVVWTAGTVLTGVAGGLTSLIIARLVVGLGEAAVYPISSAVIARWIRPTRRGLAQGVMHGSGRLGAAVAPAAVTVLVVASSWRWAFILLGVASFAITVVMWGFLRDDPRLDKRVTQEELADLGHDTGHVDEAEIRRSPPMIWSEFFARVWPVTLVSFCYGWFSWFLLSWVPLYFTHVQGLDLKGVATFATLVLIFGFIGNIGGGLATDWWLTRTGSLRRARRDVIILGFLAAMLCIVPLLLTTNLMIGTVSLALGYFFIELADSSIWMLGMDVLPSHSATSTAAVNTGFAIAGAVSPIIVGWLLDLTQSWNDVFIASLVVLLMGPIVVSRISIHQDTAEAAQGQLSQLGNVS
jgi:MFS family permease